MKGPDASAVDEPAKDPIIMFQPFASSVQVAFWQELGKLKVDVLGLDESPLDITGTYSIAAATQQQGQQQQATTPPPPPPCLTLSLDSLADLLLPRSANGYATTVPSSGECSRKSILRECRVPGVLKNFNTVEDFKAFDRNAWLQGLGNQLWEEMQSGEAVRDPCRLCRFSVLSFADLKKNRYVYWFAFPALCSSPPYRLLPPLPAGGGGGAVVVPLPAFFSEAECRLLQGGIRAFRRLRYEQTSDPHCPPFFLVVRSTTTTSSGSAASSSLSLKVAPLEEYDRLTAEVGGGGGGAILFGFMDPSTVSLHPGWPLRNLLCLLANKWNLTQATVLCYRGRITRLEAGGATATTSSHSTHEQQEVDVGGSFVIQAGLSPMTGGGLLSATTQQQQQQQGSGSSPNSSLQQQPAVLGWEKNGQGKNGPRQLDLGKLMDPVRLAEQSVDLNLKLMRWRLMPALDLPRLAHIKCLLIGAGTLGCGVARCLLGWGVRTITFIDNGRVSLSNPVRQSLFTFQDCQQQEGGGAGRLKAQAAADALAKIFPGVVSSGHVMTIPMPGHPLHTPADVEAARRDVSLLEGLVRGHDVVFLLTDTRESRWLPTLLAGVHDKMLINAALGFDSFVVMRHGGGSGDEEDDGGERDGGGGSVRLGCYFCNDVVGPKDSTKDRTLDQQCTVTRPGLAQVASALAVELMVALLHHPLGHRAPADTTEDVGGIGGISRLDDPDRPLGILPQQIRGYLSHFTTILPVTRAFRCCTGCSQVVKAQYKAQGFDLVLRACNDGLTAEQSYLEDLTGLSKLRLEAEAMDSMMMLDEDDDDDWSSGSSSSHKQEEEGGQGGGGTSLGEAGNAEGTLSGTAAGT